MSTPSSAALPADPGAYGPSGRSAWMDIDWRAHQRFVEVDGRWASVIELGGNDPARAPVVFVHGLNGSWQNWLENLPHFAAAGHRVIAFDLPGFGESQMPREKISIAGYGRFVDALLDQVGVGPAVVVGNSMGGFIGAELAIQFPERVERLVLVSAAGLTVEYQRRERVLGTLRFAENVITAWAGWIGSRSDELARRPRARRLLMGFVVHRPDLLPPALVSEQVRNSGKPGFVDALDALTDYPIRDSLGRIGCPVLIVWGTHDHLIPVRDADEFARLIPGGRKVVWPKTGHMPMLERPAAFNALVDAFAAEEANERIARPGEGRGGAARAGGGRRRGSGPERA
ncbi:MAG TPA: alpha/beta hydrolase [Solirubrobacteraceae bacterium]|nr:alpha/beta hydrolase [Solirubrobacteraceae bacterium]